MGKTWHCMYIFISLLCPIMKKDQPKLNKQVVLLPIRKIVVSLVLSILIILWSCFKFSLTFALCICYQLKRDSNCQNIDSLLGELLCDSDVVVTKTPDISVYLLILNRQ